MQLRLPTWLGWPRLDYFLLGMLLFLSIAGLFVLYSASEQDSATIIKQATRFGIGFTALAIISQVPTHLFRLWTPWLYGLGVLLLLATWLFGEGRGASRWLNIGIVRFQPSEIMKLAIPMMIAWYFHSRVLPPSLRDSLVVVGLIAIPATFIIRQPDLGTAMLVILSGCITLFLAGLRWRFIAGLALSAAVAAPIVWHFMHEYQRGRIRTFLNPESDPLGEGWNIIQSTIAAGSGGITGKGWLNGTQSHLEFLPERSTDFIMAVLAEEFGLIGVTLLLFVYCLIVYRCMVVASLARDTFGRLLAGTIGLTFFIYVLVNCGMVAGLLPVVGVPLPLVSYGGTSIVTLLGAFGLVMSIYGHRRFTR